MASTLTKILLHITFSTKHRADLIPAEHEDRLYGYIGGICRRMESALLHTGGTANHIHMLLNLGKTTALSDLMLNIKRDSSKWMKDRTPGFAWQDGYFAFSIGESATDALTAYIANQKDHHRTVGFKDEVRAFLRKYGIEIDENPLWD